MSFRHLILAALLLIGCASNPGGATSSQDPKLEIHVINVGQGDAILIRCPEGTHELLIDSGELNQRYSESGTKFKAYFGAKQAATDSIEVVVSTHPHSDHIGNMKWVVDTYSIGLYVDNGMSATSATFTKLNESLAAKSVPRKSAKDATVPDIDFCPLADVNARILRPVGFEEDEDNPNNRSVVVRVDFKNVSFLFVGDAEAEEEQLLVNDPATKVLLDCDFLKVGHHGSETSSKPFFIDAVTPKVAAISCGKKDAGTNKGYKHPRLKTLKEVLGKADPREGPALNIDAYDGDNVVWTTVKLNTAVYVTAAEGDLVFESDGSTIHKR
jgi:competence protein ComEC